MIPLELANLDANELLDRMKAVDHELNFLSEFEGKKWFSIHFYSKISRSGELYFLFTDIEVKRMVQLGLLAKDDSQQN